MLILKLNNSETKSDKIRENLCNHFEGEKSYAVVSKLVINFVDWWHCRH